MNKAKKVRNLTPHTVEVRPGNDLPNMVYPPENLPLRVKEEVTHSGGIYVENNGYLPFVVKKYTTVDGLPAPEDDTILLVSTIVLQAAGLRSDLFAPDSGPDSAIYEGQGKDRRMVAVRRLQRLP